MARHKMLGNVLDFAHCACSPGCRHYLYVGVSKDGRYVQFKFEVPHHRYFFYLDKRSLQRLFMTLLKSVNYLDFDGQELVWGLISQLTVPAKGGSVGGS